MTFEEAARYAPMVTAAVAVLAFGSAICGIGVQRSIARKRAAIDFFLKTEMDEKMWDAYHNSRKGFGALRAGVPMGEFLSSVD